MKHTSSLALFHEACALMPGGVNSPVCLRIMPMDPISWMWMATPIWIISVPGDR